MSASKAAAEVTHVGHLPHASTGSSEDDLHRVESVVRADVVLGLEGGEMLVVGRKVRLLIPEEHKRATQRRRGFLAPVERLLASADAPALLL
jgi:hypothetical protein